MKPGLGDDMAGDDWDLAQAIKANAEGIGTLLTLIILTALGQLLVLACVVLGGWLVIEDQADRTEADRQFIVDSAVDSCEDRNFTKQALRDLIRTAIADNSRGMGDLMQVEGFDDLPPSMQTYLRNLSQPSSDTPSTADRLRAYRDGLVDEDCGALAARIHAELD